MATNSTPGAKQRATAKQATPRKTPSKKPSRPTAASSTTTQPRTPIAHAQQLAERALLIPMGAGLVARDNLVSTVNSLSSRYRTRAAVGRELERFERRGATARTRLEHEMQVTRRRLERDLRQRGSRLERSVRDSRNVLERSVRDSRNRLEREVGSVRRDFEKRSARVSRLVGNAQELISAS